MARIAPWVFKRPGPASVDLLVAVLFVVLTQLDVWTSAFEESGLARAVWGDSVAGPDAISGPALLLTGLSLAWRRQRPLPSTIGVMCGIAAQAVLTGNAPQSLAVTGPMLISVYSVAAYGARRDALVGLAFTVLALAAHDINDPLLPTFMDFANEALFWWLVMLAGWITGLFVNRNRRARALEQIAARLERERDEHAQAAAAEERSRVARELHDIVSHGVGLIALQAGAAQESLEKEPTRVRDRLVAIEGTAREAATELRRMLGVLRRHEEAAERAPLPGLDDLERLTEQLRNAGVDVAVEVHGDHDSLSPAVELSAYRIIQEALTNALKHARPAHVRVVLRRSPAQLQLEISDDGQGERRTDGDGYGLIGMRERVALHGGELEVGPRSGGGYLVRARLPTTEP